MLLMKVSALLIPMTSETGDTSNIAAILGAKDFPKAVAPITIWVKLNFFWLSSTRGAIFSGRKPLNASLSATKTFFSPPLFATASAA